MTPFSLTKTRCRVICDTSGDWGFGHSLVIGPWTLGIPLATCRSTGKRSAGGFTLIEIMIVLAIIMIIMTMGVPSVLRGLTRDDLSRAVNDTVEGCKTARDRAILQGIPYEFVLSSEGQMMVNSLPPVRGEALIPDVQGGTARAIPAGPYAGFPRHLAEDVAIQEVGVNFITQMNAPDARVRFFPNGTCDEFTVVYNWHGKQRTVMADIVTGQVSEYVRQ
jgi:prepilin-type N-terminal cleavage/methylation domain-containing protein